jgi:hypothetical protein
MTLAIPIRLSSCFALIMCGLQFLVAQKQDSVIIPLSVVPYLFIPGPDSLVVNSRKWSRSLILGTGFADVITAECSYRQVRNGRGFELSAFAIPKGRRGSEYFEGEIINRLREIKADTSSNFPYRRITGDWKTVEGSWLAPAPSVFTTRIVGFSFSIPFVFYSSNEHINWWLAPGVGVYQHRYFTIKDLPISAKELSQTSVNGIPPYDVKTVKSVRDIEQRRVILQKTTYSPFLNYSLGLDMKLTHHISASLGANVAFQPRDYNEPTILTITKQLSARGKVGIIYKINPGKKPLKPIERTLIRL